MFSSNYLVLLLGALALAAGAGFFFVDSGWIAGALALVAIACLLTFIMLTIARVQRPDETPAQTARRLEEIAGEFDQDP
jgi:hypothetical protein